MDCGNWRRLGAGVAVASLTIVCPAIAQPHAFHAEHVLGTSLDVSVAANSREEAELAWQAARAEISRLEKLYSTWLEDSEVSRLNRDRRVAVGTQTGQLLERCNHWNLETGGALDCRLGKLIAKWQGAAQGNVLSPDEIGVLIDDSTQTRIVLENGEAHLEGHADLKVDALAKGMIIDAALEAARAAAPGAQSIVVNIGGDIRVFGAPDGKGLKVGVAGPRAADNEAPEETLLLSNAAIASSGASGRDLEIAGHQRSHIISPLTGRPQDLVETVTVVAPDAETADALATAFSVTGTAKSLGYANTHDGVEVMIITSGGTRFTSNGWKDLRAPVETISAKEAGIENPWPEGWRLGISYAIPKIDVGDYEYPYVVAWVTDSENKPVRHLLMLGDSPRWLEENYVHWRRVGRKLPAVVDHVARPTRPPGRYDIVWDGHDEEGRPVEQGEYTLHIEASREHGGHQYEKIALNLTDEVVSQSVQPGDELGAVKIVYDQGEGGR